MDSASRSHFSYIPVIFSNNIHLGEQSANSPIINFSSTARRLFVWLLKTYGPIGHQPSETLVENVTIKHGLQLVAKILKEMSHCLMMNRKFPLTLSAFVQ